jgi:hypothetical protein
MGLKSDEVQTVDSIQLKFSEDEMKQRVSQHIKNLRGRGMLPAFTADTGIVQLRPQESTSQQVYIHTHCAVHEMLSMSVCCTHIHMYMYHNATPSPYYIILTSYS